MTKILHIDNQYQVFYILIKEGSLITSTVPLECAVSMLKKDYFDLILSEPQQMAILTPDTADGGRLADQNLYSVLEKGSPLGKEFG
jgi:hypothetical protein